MQTIRYSKTFNNRNLTYFMMLICTYYEKNNFFEDDNIFSILHILNEVILECNNNNLRNSDNVKIFKKRIKNIINSDYLLDKELKKELNFLDEQLYKKNTDSVISICRIIKNQVQKKEYFNSLVDNLIFLINDESNNNSESIRVLCVNVIIHLLYIGYTFKSVIRNIKDLFSESDVITTKNGYVIHTMFPTQYLIKKTDVIELNDYINSMNYQERLVLLKKLYIIDENYYYYISTINGMSLNETVKLNNDITLYNPKNTCLYPLCEGNDVFQNDSLDKDFYDNNVNISVRIKSVCLEAVSDSAKEKICNFLNILKSFTPNDNYVLSNKRFIILDLNKKTVLCKYNQLGNNNEVRSSERELYNLKYDDFFNDRLINRWNKDTSFLINDSNNNNYKIILDSVRKYSEAIDSSNEQEALLKYWSALECLFDEKQSDNVDESKISTIINNLSVHTIISRRYKILHDVYNHLRKYSFSEYGDNVRNRNAIINIPDRLLKKCELITKKKNVNLFSLVKNCAEVKTYIGENIFLHDELCEVENLYNKINYAYQKYNENITDMKNNIQLIYRLRNQIIHNANCNKITNKFYLTIIKEIYLYIINSLINEFIANKNVTIFEALMNIYTNDVIMMKKLENSTLNIITFND